MAFIYSDVNQFTPTTKPLLLDVESVYQSIFNILNTRKGERIFFPNFGIDLEDELFELIDDVSAVEILRVIIEGIGLFEPRVTIDTTNTEVIPMPDDNKFDIDIAFNIEGVDDQTFNFQGALAA